MCGCALRSLGTPWVAQRVWAMPRWPVDRGLIQRILQRLHLALGAQAGQVLGTVEHGEAGRVVAPVLQPPQALHQHRDDVAIGDRPNDSAHM